MSRPFTVVILAGTLNPPPFRRQLGFPLLCLPVGGHDTLLGAWFSTVGQLPGCTALRVVVNTEPDARMLGALTEALPCCDAATVTVEPAMWRGSGGLVRDACADLEPGGIVVVIEGHCLPPPSLEPLLGAFDHETDGVVGAGPDSEAAGVYAFGHKAIETIPTLGYHDLKEQLLPGLSQRGARLRVAHVSDSVIRIRDRCGYLEALRVSLARSHGTGPSGQARVSRSARIGGSSIVGPHATIENDAVIFDSAVLPGGTVRAGAMVVRSVIAPDAEVPPASRIIDRVVSRRSADPQPVQHWAGAAPVRRWVRERGAPT